MMARSSSIIMQNLVEIERRTDDERTKCDVFHFFVCLCFLFVNNARMLHVPNDVGVLYKRR